MARRGNPNPCPEHRFKPGKSGNPGGVPRGKRISTWMAEFGEMDPKDWPDPSNLPANARIALARLRAAMGKDGRQDTELILDRTEGKVAEKTELTGKDGGPVTFTLEIKT